MEPIREAVLAEMKRRGWSYYRLARELGWMRLDRKRGRVPDGAEVRRVLGLKKVREWHGHGKGRNVRMHYDVALHISRTLGIDPWELGL